MSDFLSIKIEGLDKLIKDFKELPAKITKEVEGELMFAGQEVINRAIRDVPVRTGRLKQGIGPAPVKTGRLTVEITSNAHYTAYVEFGTGDFVSIPEGLEDFAAQFKGQGIRKVNRRAKPFIFPALFFVRIDLQNRISQIFSNL